MTEGLLFSYWARHERQACALSMWEPDESGVTGDQDLYVALVASSGRRTVNRQPEPSLWTSI